MGNGSRKGRACGMQCEFGLWSEYCFVLIFFAFPYYNVIISFIDLSNPLIRFMGMRSMHRDESMVEFLLKMLMQVLINFSMGLIMALFVSNEMMCISCF